MKFRRLFPVLVLVFVNFLPSLCAVADEETIGAYMTRLQKTIKNNWKPSRLGKSYKIVANFKVDKFGMVRDLKLVNKHENEEANEEAIAAIKLSEPFSSPVYLNLPDLETHGSIEIEFDFDYNVKHTLISTEHKELISKEFQEIKDSPMVQGFFKQNFPITKLLQYFFYALIGLLVIYLRLTSIFKNLDETGSQKKTNLNNKPNRYDPTNVTERK